jgi:hypothetical protein
MVRNLKCGLSVPRLLREERIGFEASELNIEARSFIDCVVEPICDLDAVAVPYIVWTLILRIEQTWSALHRQNA